MKKLSIFFGILLCFSSIYGQFFPANGIGYQAMLSQPEKITYGTKLKNIPVANTEVKARFELSQTGAVIFTDEHTVTTDVNGIFSCIIGTGNVTPVGINLSDLDWAADSVTIRVFIDAGEGENLFSEQKLWSTAYAMYAAKAGKALNDKDTSATNELQYLNLTGDSIKLSAVSGGISLKPWTDGIAKNALDISTEKTRAEAAELALQNQISGINASLGNKTNELDAAKDTLTKFRSEINILNNGVSQNESDISKNTTNISNNSSDIANNTSDINKNKTDITKNTADIKDVSDSIAVHRSELNRNRGDINKNASDIATNKSDIAQNKTDIGTNATDIGKNKSDIDNNTKAIQVNSDSLKVHRAELNKNRGDINKNASDITTNKSDIAQNKTDIGTNSTDIGKNKSDIANNTKAIQVNSDSLKVHRNELNKNRSDINKNSADIAQNKSDLSQHISNDKDTDNTNELSDLNYNSSTYELNLSNPSTAGNKVDLSGLRDNLGNHIATDTLDLNKQILTDRTADTLKIQIVGNDRDIQILSEDEIYLRTVNNPNNSTNGDIELHSSDDIILNAATDIDIISDDDVLIEANGDDIELNSSDDIKIYSGEDIFMRGQNVVEISSGGGDNITIDSDNDIELKTTANDYVEIWNNGSFMYTLPNKRGTVGQFLQRSADGGSEYFSDWSTYKLPTSDGTTGQTLVTDGSGNVTWQSASSGGSSVSELKDLNDAHTYGTGSVMLGSTTTGTINNANHNFSSGQNALKLITTGDNNIAIGYNTLDAITTSGNLVAMGYAALGSCTTATNSIAIGYGALSGALKSSDNIAIGNGTMTANTIGYGNTALGYSALSKVVNYLNTAVGYNAGKNTQTSGTNTYYGGYNTFMGANSAEYNSLGSHNTTLGFKALWMPGAYSAASSGDGNVALGSQALWSNTGSRNVAIGMGANMSSSANNPPLAFTGSNTIALGGGAQPSSLSVSNEMRLGNTSITSLRSQVSLTVTSDARVKQNIENNVHGLDFIMKLNPVTYNYSLDAMNDLQARMGFEVDTFEYAEKRAIEGIRFSGFLAQDVESAATQVGYEFSGVDKPETKGAVMGLRYSEFVVPLVKATQEQQIIIEKQQETIQKQNEAIEALIKRIEALESK